jgi:hypothetical protein
MRACVVDGWLVSCQVPDPAVCESIAAVALNNLGRGRPAEPQGPLTVRERRTCPEVPDWADPAQCWEAMIPLGPGAEPACMVYARRPELGGYGKVAGDDLTGLVVPDPQPGCPSE